MNVSGQGEQLTQGQHGHSLLPHGLGGFLEIQLLGHWDHEHVMIARLPGGDQRLEHAIRVLPQQSGYLNATGRPVRFERAEGEGDASRLHFTDGIGLGRLLRHGR